VWLHAASVGETLATLPLAAQLTVRGFAVLFTTGTVTAAQVVSERLPAGAIHQFAVIDTPAAVSRFLDHWRPGLALFAESELWPATLNLLADRAVPTVVVNARMSDRSFRRWRRVKPIAGAVLGKVELFVAQSSEDAHRLRELGDARVVVCGNLKIDVAPPRADEAKLATIRRAIGERRVLLAASTHPGEEAAVVAAHLELARAGIRLLTIIAPRHPHCGKAVMAEIAATPLSARCRSAGDDITADTDIFVVD
jgi:3-deoxy-D-manno-octulosonic-acid transferase